MIKLRALLCSHITVESQVYWYCVLFNRRFDQDLHKQKQKKTVKLMRKTSVTTTFSVHFKLYKSGLTSGSSVVHGRP